MSETITLDVHATQFEVQRAITVYIPLLEACYNLAKDAPYGLPPGYVELGLVEAGVGAMASMSGGAAGPATPEAFAMSVAMSKPDRFGFVIQETATGHVLVGIRGTMFFEEWLRNFTAVAVDYDFIAPFGDVHLGFREMYRAVRNSIHHALSPVSPRTRITIVGHSLGGAMSVVAAPDIARNLGKQLVDVCTVGGPRVGNSGFRDSFNAVVPRCCRVTNQFDIVPHVPTLVTGWRHVGEEIEVDGNVSSPHSLTAYLAGLRAIAAPSPFMLRTGELSPYGLTARDQAVTGLLAATVP